MLRGVLRASGVERSRPWHLELLDLVLLRDVPARGRGHAVSPGGALRLNSRADGEG